MGVHYNYCECTLKFAYIVQLNSFAQIHIGRALLRFFFFGMDTAAYIIGTYRYSPISNEASILALVGSAELHRKGN